MTLAREIKVNFTVNESFAPYKIACSEDVYKYAKPLFCESINIYESVYALFFDNSNQLLGFYKVSQGGITSSVVDVRLLLSTALNCLATSLILIHNHPTGNLKPSVEDMKITNQIKEASSLLNIRLLDHMIVTNSGFFSFADEGLL